MKSIEVSSRTNPLLIVHNQEEIKLYVNIPPFPPPPPSKNRYFRYFRKLILPFRDTIDIRK